MQKVHSVTRKKFISWGVIMSFLMAIPSFILFKKTRKGSPIQTTKMLTRDGRLVEIDVTKITGKAKKIKDEEIHFWIKNKKNI